MRKSSVAHVASVSSAALSGVGILSGCLDF